jgi:hypothetical protein
MVNAEAPSRALRCRQIGPSDIDAVVDLLDRGFPVRGRAYWARALARLAKHESPAGFPQYGYVLDCAAPWSA